MALAIFFASASTDYWTVMRFFGSHGLTLAPDAWRDPVFSRPLSFYLFDLPFYSETLWFVISLAILCTVIFWATARGWQLWMRGRRVEAFDRGALVLMLPGASRTGFRAGGSTG